MKLKQIYVLGAYLLIGVGVNLLAPGGWETQQWVGWLLVMGALFAVDLISFSQGVDRGLEIAKEVMSDLCREKKIKVVPNA